MNDKCDNDYVLFKPIIVKCIAILNTELLNSFEFFSLSSNETGFESIFLISKSANIESSYVKDNYLEVIRGLLTSILETFHYFKDDNFDSNSQMMKSISQSLKNVQIDNNNNSVNCPNSLLNSYKFYMGSLFSKVSSEVNENKWNILDYSSKIIYYLIETSRKLDKCSNFDLIANNLALSFKEIIKVCIDNLSVASKDSIQKIFECLKLLSIHFFKSISIIDHELLAECKNDITLFINTSWSICNSLPHLDIKTFQAFIEYIFDSNIIQILDEDFLQVKFINNIIIILNIIIIINFLYYYFSIILN